MSLLLKEGKDDDYYIIRMRHIRTNDILFLTQVVLHPIFVSLSMESQI